MVEGIEHRSLREWRQRIARGICVLQVGVHDARGRVYAGVGAATEDSRWRSRRMLGQLGERRLALRLHRWQIAALAASAAAVAILALRAVKRRADVLDD